MLEKGKGLIIIEKISKSIRILSKETIVIVSKLVGNK